MTPRAIRRDIVQRMRELLDRFNVNSNYNVNLNSNFNTRVSLIITWASSNGGSSTLVRNLLIFFSPSVPLVYASAASSHYLSFSTFGAPITTNIPCAPLSVGLDRPFLTQK